VPATLERARQAHREKREAECEKHVDAPIGELHVGSRRIADHRHGDFLIPEPFEHIEQRERIGEHREREVVAA